MIVRTLLGPTCVTAIMLACAPSPPPAPLPPVADPAPAPAPASPPPPVASTPAPAPAPKPKETCDGTPPADMIKGNLHATPMSGIAEIVSSSVIPTKAGGYVNIRYEVKVLKWYASDGPATMSLFQGVEEGFKPRPAGQLMFFSACKSADGTGYEPDVGFFFPFEPECKASFEAIAEKESKKIPPASKRKLTACSAKR